MDPRRNLFPEEEPEEEYFQPEITSPPGIAMNGGQAQGEIDAHDAQQPQDAQDQPSTVPNGNDQNPAQCVNTQRRAPRNGQNSAPTARYIPREQPNPYGGYQSTAYQQYSEPYSTNGGY